MPIQTRVLEAVRWTTATRFGGYLFTWSINLAVLRLLQPSDYGLMALCMVGVGLADLLGMFGQRTMLIQRRTLDEGLVAKVFGALLLWNVFLLLILQAIARPYAGFYGQPTLEPMIRVMALGVFLGSLVGIPVALRWRDIDFQAVSIVGMIHAISTSVVVLFLAWRGLGVWALVGGQFAGMIIHAAGILWVTGFRVRPDFRVWSLGAELRFGSLIAARALVGYFSRQVDTLLIGKLLGSAPLGVYSVALNISRQPVRSLLQPIQYVATPAFARIQDDPEQVRAYHLRSVEFIAFAFFPIFWGLGAVASDLVPLVMGSRWVGAIPILQIFCLILPLRSLMRILPAILDGLGRPEISLRMSVTLVVLVPVGIVLGAQEGIVGATWGWLAAHALAMVINLRMALPVIGTRLGPLLGAFWRTVLASAAMVAVVVGAGSALAGTLEPLWRLPALVGLGAAGYGLATLAVNRNLLWRAVRLFRP